MQKALEIRQDQIRAEREKLLSSLNIQFMKAIEQGNTQEQQRISAEKQRLKDATSHPDLLSAETPEELLSVNPLVNG